MGGFAGRNDHCAAHSWRPAIPALGFFGATATDCLQLKLPEPVAGLALFLGNDAREFLNFRGVRFIRDGAPLTLDPGGFQVEASSVSGASRSAGSTPLTRLGGHHSALEKGPWWRVRFERPVAADELQIYNRADRWGSRTASLCVEVTGASGVVHPIYSGQGAEAVAIVDQALASVGIALPGPDRRHDASACTEWRIEALARLAGLLRAKADAVPDTAWRGVIQLIDFWSPRAPLDDELTLLAGYLIAQRERQHATSLRAFSAILGSRRALDRLGGALAEIARTAGADPLLLTRHGLSAAGKLVNNTPEVLDHLNDVMDILEAKGGAPMLAYGTLLGAVRAGAFIPHDDDVDVLFMASSTDRNAVEAEIVELKQTFLQAGYTRVNHVPRSLNLHVFHPVTGAMVDVFPCWEHDGKTSLHMESMKIRAISTDTFRPRSVVRLYDRLYPAPGSPEEFLRERYGNSWTDTDPYFEWPWPLHDDDA